MRYVLRCNIFMHVRDLFVSRFAQHVSFPLFGSQLWRSARPPQVLPVPSGVVLWT